MDEIRSVIFYISIFAVSTLFAVKSQKRVIVSGNELKAKSYFNCRAYVLSFAVLWVFLFFTNIGPDYDSYHLIISRLTWQNFASFEDLEPLFNIIVLCFQTITKSNIHLTIGLIKTLSLVGTYSAIFFLRDRISIGFSIFCYILWCYLESYYLLPMFLATSLIILGVAMLVRYNKKSLALIFFVLASQVHNSAYIMLVVFVFMLILSSSKKFSFLWKLLIIGAYALSLFLYSNLFELFSIILPNFHYGNYYGGIEANLGLFFFAIYIPLFIIVYIVCKEEKDKVNRNNIYLFAISSAFVKLLSYRFTVIGRVEFFLIPLYMVFFSQFLRKERDSVYLNNWQSKTIRFSSLDIILCAYVFFRGYLYFSNELQWLGTYEFFNPFLN